MCVLDSDLCEKSRTFRTIDEEGFKIKEKVSRITVVSLTLRLVERDLVVGVASERRCLVD
jgi:hypothetical protein